jgi:hypothetical protein
MGRTTSLVVRLVLAAAASLHAPAVERAAVVGGAPTMSGKRKTSGSASASPTSYDIAALLRYEGPSTRMDGPIENGIETIDYRDSEKNLRHLTALLSSQGIPFYLERPRRRWSGLWPRMILSLPAERYPEAAVLLQAAVAASALDVVEGSEGLYSR